jgi:alpha-beta hydrolase superfamily lysophospholipase
MAAKTINTVISTVFGYVHRSPFFGRIMFGDNNKRISNLKTPYDWLTKDEVIVKKYSEDPACTFLFTGNGIKGLMDTVTYVIKQKHVNLTPVDLPMLFVAGKEDPVGEYGEAVKRAFAMYEAHQMKHISLKLYESDRHEILNEIDREQVYQDIYLWSEGVINS